LAVASRRGPELEGAAGNDGQCRRDQGRCGVSLGRYLRWSPDAADDRTIHYLGVRKGFVPGERLDIVLFDEPVVERRWWRKAANSA
jgi:hypothetical protein